MKCNKCGNICDDNTKFCTKCGNALTEEYVQSFSEEAQNYNGYEKREIPQSSLERFITSKEFFAICSVVFVVIVSIIIFSVMSTINLPKLIHETTTLKAENCEAETVKNLVVDIVKKNDYFYNDIDPDSISNVYLRYPATSGYENDIDKYHCTGQFVMESVYGGFKPTSATSDNHYYNKFHSYYDYYEDRLAKNTLYVCSVKYSSQLSEGRTLVESTYCSSGGGWFDSGTQGTFSCEGGDCEPIIIQKKDRSNIEDSSSSTSYQYTSENKSLSDEDYNSSDAQSVENNNRSSFHSMENLQNAEQTKQNIIRDIEDAENELF